MAKTKAVPASDAEAIPETLFDHFQFDPRFLERLAGKKLLKEPRVAVVELVANAWDAGATEVSVTWPTETNDGFAVKDNGQGMTEQQFLQRWQWMAYDRLKHQGSTTTLPSKPDHPARRVYGRNGIGRFAAFCFGDEYKVTTKRDGQQVSYRVWRGSDHDRPFEKERIAENSVKARGTTISTTHCRTVRLDEDDVRSELAMRFLADPTFTIKVNGAKVDLHSIPDTNVTVEPITVAEVGDIEVIVIDTSRTDRTMQHHGIAFHVNNRLVGDIAWKQPGFSDTVDGRSVGGKRLLFIVKADVLHDRDAVKEDWTGFDEEHEDYLRVAAAVEKFIQTQLDTLNEEEQEDVLKVATAASMPALRKLEVGEVEKWTDFVKHAQAECRSVKRTDLVKLSQLLANLEASRSKYALIDRLAELHPGQLDDLHGLLEEWSVDTAKLVLDEIRTRLRLLTELERKAADNTTDEVQELQPLFKAGLWIFGPEFESIHFTSNQQMVTVIRDLCGRDDVKGSTNRPDFVVLHDGSAGFYTCPSFGSAADGDTGELGIARLVIIELKRPGVAIGTDQKTQCWKYVKELFKKGLIDGYTRVDCYVLGDSVEPAENHRMEQLDGRCKIMPMRYDTVITRAKSRLHNLHDQVRDAPFMREALAEFEAAENVIKSNRTLFDDHMEASA